MTRAYQINKEKKAKRKAVFRYIRIFLTTFVVTVLIICLSGVALIRFGAFPEIKKIIVESAMTTLNHKYIAKIFATDKEIAAIMDSGKIDDTFENTDIASIHPVEKPTDDIQLIPIKGSTYKGYILSVKDPSRVDIGVSTGLGSSGMKVEDIVKQYNAIGGINAGGFDDPEGKGKGGVPVDLLIRDGKILNIDRTNSHFLIGFNNNNILTLGNYTTQQIKDMKLRCAVSFRPFLVINGKPTIKSGDGGWGIAPRTAIGQKADGTVLLLAIDGRQLGSLGASLKDVQDIMLEYGALNAANLDGGSSTTLIYNNEVVNSPCSKYGARYVPSAFIVK
ncbi:MAG: phosphodiester glycosidase family protein [Bacillota bacterium]|nr:phosphodiester glycosidase family protein [Bacillota bacterium]